MTPIFEDKIKKKKDYWKTQIKNWNFFFFSCFFFLTDHKKKIKDHFFPNQNLLFFFHIWN